MQVYINLFLFTKKISLNYSILMKTGWLNTSLTCSGYMYYRTASRVGSASIDSRLDYIGLTEKYYFL